MGAALGLVVGSACLDIPSYVCTGDTQCVAEGVFGACDFQSGVCIYPNQGCPTFYSDVQGNCTGPANGAAGTGADGADGADDGTPDDGGSPDTGMDDGVDDGVDDGSNDTTTDGPDLTDDGPPDTDTSDTNDLPCGGAPLSNITGEGVVSASSVFDDGFEAAESVDGDLSTSWFSSGPGAGDPSIFEWSAGQDVCITTIVFTGNGLHTNPSFQDGFGFGLLNAIVFDEFNGIAFEQLIPSPGMPGEMIAVGGVVGRRVRFELSDHESNECGGFSEMQVLGAVGG